MAQVEVRVDSIRQDFLQRYHIDYPWVVILKSKSSNDYLPIYISKSQADLIQKLLLDDEAIPIESLLSDLSLPVEQMSKGILESIILESPEENKYRAKLVPKEDDLVRQFYILELESIPIVIGCQYLRSDLGLGRGGGVGIR